MNDLIKILFRLQRFIIFIFLELICLYLLIQNNNIHRSSFISSSNYVSGILYDFKTNVSNFLDLKSTNKLLLEENTRLKNKLLQFKTNIIDTGLSHRNYRYRSANVINISVNRTKNYITIDKGSKDGIKPEMAVLSHNGIVGLIINVRSHFSTVLPIINPTFSISAKIKRNNFYGSLSWNNESYRQANLKEIPFHAKVNIGDTIVTSGYSSIFPREIKIGTISNYRHKDGDNFLDINVKLTVDFKNLKTVYIVENLNKEEIKTLENETTND